MVFRVRADDRRRRFEALVIPYSASAYNLACWLLGNEADAEDVVQDALVRAFRHLDSLRTQNVRAWLLQIVRNTAYTQMHGRKATVDLSIEEIGDTQAGEESNPAALVLRTIDRENLRRAIDDLPVEYREAIVLRELEGLSYREIADVADIPIGTVMSRLARARTRIQNAIEASEVEKG